MGMMASPITSLTTVCPTIYSGTDQRKHQNSASLAFVWGIHWWPVNSPHKWPVMRKMFPFDDVVMYSGIDTMLIDFKILLSYIALYVILFLLAKAPVTHVLQPVGDCLATKKQLQPMQPLCDQNCIFSVADQSATGRRQLSLKIGDQSATGWLPTDWKWVAIGRQLVGDWSATGRQWVGDWLSIKQFAV